MLRVFGTSFDPDAFLRDAEWTAYHIWHRGEPRRKTGRFASVMHEYGGFCCDVSKVDGDLSGQLKDAEAFLIRYRKDFLRLAATPEVEESKLDFGYCCRLQDNILMQGEYLPVSFLQLVGELKVAVALSLYPGRSAIKPSSFSPEADRDA